MLHYTENPFVFGQLHIQGTSSNVSINKNSSVAYFTLEIAVQIRIVLCQLFYKQFHGMVWLTNLKDKDAHRIKGKSEN